MNRIDRHNNNNKVNKRTVKNQNLYQDAKDYTTLQEDVIIESIIEIDLEKKEPKREIKHQDIINKKIISPLYNLKDEKKEYDINKILNTAKENRKDIDEREEKRHLKKDEYNIAKNIDLKNLDKYKKKDKDGLDDTEKEELKELINTIYSNNLKEEINKKETENQDLFSDLMAGVNETIIDEDMASKMIEEEKKDKTNELKSIDDSFFTTSLGLNVDDFVDNGNDNNSDMDDSFIEENDPKRIIIIIAVVLVVLIILGILCYFIYKSI